MRKQCLFDSNHLIDEYGYHKHLLNCQSKLKKDWRNCKYNDTHWTIYNQIEFHEKCTDFLLTFRWMSKQSSVHSGPEGVLQEEGGRDQEETARATTKEKLKIGGNFKRVEGAVEVQPKAIDWRNIFCPKTLWRKNQLRVNLNDWRHPSRSRHLTCIKLAQPLDFGSASGTELWWNFKIKPHCP